MILCLPCGNVTFCWANILILFLTVSMPRSLDAFNSITPSLKDEPKSCLARHMIVVVLPTPGGPAMMMFDTLPSLANNLRKGGRSILLNPGHISSTCCFALLTIC